MAAKINRVSVALTLATGLVLAGAAFVLVNQSFQPFSVRFTLAGRDQQQPFTLKTREPLFLEYEIVVRSEGRDRPPVVVTLNDRAVAVPAAAAAYSTERAVVPLPFEAVHAGTNVLRVRVGGAEPNTVDMRARVHNYYGIAPDFPRAAIVGDEAVAHRRSQTSVAASAARLLALIALSVGSVWLLVRIGRRGTTLWARADVLLLLLGPLAALIFGMGRPLHVWLPLESLAVIALVPWLVGQLASWLMAHRAATFAVLAPVVVTLVALEGGLRLFNAFRPTYVFYSDSYSRFRGQPGARHFDATLNSRGFNDTEHAVARPANVAYRVVALGDSFAVGVVPQRDNFLTQLESLLSREAPVEVINMGISGAEPGDYLSILANEGLTYGPDLVLVNFFVGNDFETRSRRWHERSYLTTLAGALWRLGRSPGTVAAPGGQQSVYDDNAPGMQPDPFMEVQVDRSWVFERDSPRIAAAVARAAGFLEQIQSLARRDRADLLVALIPDETQIDGDLRARVAAARDMSSEQLNAEQPNRLLTRALAAEKIDVLDLLSALSEAASHGRVYKPADTHWNRAGNRVAAETIARALADRVARASRRGLP